MRQRQPRERFGDMAHLGRRRSEELAAHGRVEEQVLDLDARAGRAVPRADGAEIAAVADDFGAAAFFGRPRLQRHLGDAADGGEGFAAEAEGLDAKEVVGVVELAGGVGGEGQRQVVGVDAAAVVGDADQLDAALFHVHVHAAGAGVDGVFEEFLEDAGRPFDDLAGGDLVDDQRRQLADAGHQDEFSIRQTECRVWRRNAGSPSELLFRVPPTRPAGARHRPRCRFLELVGDARNSTWTGTTSCSARNTPSRFPSFGLYTTCARRFGPQEITPASPSSSSSISMWTPNRDRAPAIASNSSCSHARQSIRKTKGLSNSTASKSLRSKPSSLTQRS